MMNSNSLLPRADENVTYDEMPNLYTAFLGALMVLFVKDLEFVYFIV